MRNVRQNFLKFSNINYTRSKFYISRTYENFLKNPHQRVNSQIDSLANVLAIKAKFALSVIRKFQRPQEFCAHTRIPTSLPKPTWTAHRFCHYPPANERRSPIFFSINPGRTKGAPSLPRKRRNNRIIQFSKSAKSMARLYERARVHGWKSRNDVKMTWRNVPMQCFPSSLSESR